MGTALDALNPAPQPLTARRPAASNLPVFELPPPANFGLVNTSTKFPSPSNVSNLLTPPSNHSGEGTTNTLHPGPNISTAISAAQEVSSYPPSWQNQNSYTYGSPSQPSWGASSATGVFQPRSVLSPPSVTISRTSGSLPPTTNEGMAQPYDLNHHLPPFQQQSIPTSSPASATTLLPHAQHPHPQSQPMAHTGLHGIPTTTAAPSHHMATVDLYGSRPLVSPLYNTSPTAGAPHPGTYAPSYGGPSAVGQSGLGIHTSRLPSGPTQSPPMQPPQLGYSRPPWPSYSLPAMAGPIMTNVHNPNGQMSLMGNMTSTMMPGFTSGHLASMQHMYGSHPSHHQGHGSSAASNDRPFKCDQCPQSFNRNHDLKRHKRIHLSVKPFPCTHCEKSFSRKDALKRHLLVKGCGKNTDNSSNSGAKDDESVSKFDSHSDKASPLSNGI
ncbi:hypothetical protein UA08_02877 [Talaromyces atroroseus]|uniref:C2H2-type domain-containing protein n=1 Tax=Talaromyces atroroseus TaxID=1441469 RepID=A0A225AWV7_TALAT|nr:hypothetical protein UA08_02877 [Talaromyces atroroseus]OKL61808.1 hypothetical protein UA08_02877 [Talaromyces atroroseus]